MTTAPINSRHAGEGNGEGQEAHEGRRQVRQGQARLLTAAQAGGLHKAPPADLFRLLRDDPLSKTDEAVEAWAAHQAGYKQTLGYGESDGSCRDAVSSETWDSATEILERRVDALVIDAVDGAMASLDGPQRAMIWAVYCNRVGPAVWRSRWLDRKTPDELVALHRAALTMLRPLLRARGLVV